MGCQTLMSQVLLNMINISIEVLVIRWDLAGIKVQNFVALVDVHISD